MIRVEEVRDLALPVEAAFVYVADFANVEEWDPGVLSSSRQGDDPAGLGTRYDVLATFGKATIPLVYELTVWEPPSRAVLATSSKRFDGVDTITFERLDAERTRVVYVAEFRLKGVMRLLGPFVRPMFTRLAKKALDGLAEAVAQGRPGLAGRAREES